MDELLQQLYSPHAEESMIGAVIINPREMDSVDLCAEDFYINRWATVWRAIKSIRARGMECDFVTLGDELHKLGKLEEVGGPATLMSLITNTPSSMGAEDYARIIKEKAMRRHTLMVANELAKLAYDQTKDLEEGISQNMTQLVNVSSSGLGAVHWSEYLRRAMDFVETRADNPNPIWGIRTGFSKFDYLTGGLQLYELLILSGEPGVGKSIFVMQLAEQMAGGAPGYPGAPGAVYSLEMKGEAIAMRTISAASKIKTRAMKSGTMQDEQWPVYYDRTERLASLPIYMSDDTRWTTSALRADLARLKAQHKIKWFVIDYSYLLQDGMGTMNDTERTQYISAAMKAICKSLGLAGIMIHSMNKAGMQAATVGQSALRGSGQVQYDADVILLLTNPDKQRPNLVRCEFGKGREIDSGAKFFDIERSTDGVPVYTEVTVTVNPMNPGDKVRL